MNYFVIGPDGSKFGPADFMVLNQWAQEGRILPHTLIEEVGTGRQFTAAQLPGITIPNSDAYRSPYQTSPSNYPKIVDTEADKLANWAYAMAWLNVLLCPGLALLGLVLAGIAIQQGSTKGPRALKANIFSIVLLIVGAIVLQAAISSLLSSI